MQRQPLLLDEIKANVELISKKNNDAVNIHAENLNHLSAVKFIENLLNSESSNPDKLQQFFNTHTIEEQITFLQTLARNDKESVFIMLSQIVFADKIKSNSVSINELREIANKIPDDQKLNFATSSRIQEITTQMLLHNVSHASTSHDRENIISKIMTNIPDSVIDIHSKARICLSVDSGLEISSVNIAYNEPVKQLKQGKFLGEISLKEFKVASLSGSVDDSQFIMLVLGLIQKSSETNPQIKNAIKTIRTYYLNADYDSALTTITAMCSHPDVIGKDKADAISELQQRIKLVNVENYSRRFFENRLAALHQGNLDNFHSIDNIAAHFFQDHQPIKNETEAMYTISNLAELNNNSLYNRMRHLQDTSHSFTNRGRHIKTGFTPRYKERQGFLSDTVLTRNPGIMKSNQPNFPDELSTHTIRNNPADTNFYTNDKVNYPSMHPRGAFVTSISGHAFFMAAILEEYMMHSGKDKTVIETDINNMINALASTYIRRGYHALAEITDVFSEPHVKKIFEDNGIKINLSWPKVLLAEAFKDTQTYTNQIALKQTVQSELKFKFERFCSAVENNDLAAVTLAIKQGINVNIPNEMDLTPFYIAAFYGHKDIADKIAAAKSFDINIKEINGFTQLYIAAGEGHHEVVQMLLEKGADETISNPTGETPLHVAVRNNHINAVRSLLEKGANPNIKDMDGSTPLHYAASGNNTAILSLLLKYGADPHMQNVDDYTPFYLAAYVNNDAAIKKLSPNQDINRKGNDGSTQLHVAIKNNHLEVLEMLLNHDDIDPNVQDKNGYTPLHLAIENGNLDAVKMLLSYKANPNIQDYDDFTPFHLAAKSDKPASIDIMRALLIKRRNLEFTPQNNDYTSPLYLAAFYGHTDIFNELLKNSTINFQDKNGNTQLHLAAHYGHQHVIEMLLKNGADPDIKNKNQLSPRDVATNNGHEYMFENRHEDGMSRNEKIELTKLYEQATKYIMKLKNLKLNPNYEIIFNGSQKQIINSNMSSLGHFLEDLDMMNSFNINAKELNDLKKRLAQTLQSINEFAQSVAASSQPTHQSSTAEVGKKLHITLRKTKTSQPYPYQNSEPEKSAKTQLKVNNPKSVASEINPEDNSPKHGRRS